MCTFVALKIFKLKDKNDEKGNYYFTCGFDRIGWA